MKEIFFSITLFCYFLATLIHFLFLGLRRNLLLFIAMVTVVVGFICHTTALIFISFETGHGPYTNFFEYMAFFPWTIVLIYLIVEFRYRIKDLGSFVIPLAFLMLAYSKLLPEEVSPSTNVLRFWATLHYTLSFLGYAAFALTFGAGLMYMIQERQLKSKKPGSFYYRLPSLELLDNLNHRLISIGFPLFTLGFVTGSIWIGKIKGDYLSWDPVKTLPLIITWMIYAALFIGRITVGWRRRRAALGAIIGFFLIIITYWMHVN
ncbi:MAG: cytochrome c biogenesis protein CcsA [Nitrospinae bacterium]|nr:cytochrome c biogenesis protein CcsA [Nitrospinota bacterium]